MLRTALEKANGQLKSGKLDGIYAFADAVYCRDYGRGFRRAGHARVNVFPSFLQPLDKPVPMVATADIGRVAAELIQTTWSGRSVVELEGPHRVNPEEIAATFADLLGRPVRTEAVPRETWESLFQSQGMKNPAPRIQMLDGFNEGWIEFESGEAGSRKGKVELRTVLQRLIERESRS